MAIQAADMEVDKKEQLEKIEDFCLPDETIRAVYDLKGGGTGFIGITDRRIIFYDKVFLKKRKVIVSVPYSRIASIGSEDSKGILIKRGFFASNTLVITALGFEGKEFEFRGGDKAHKAHRIISEYLL